MPHERRGERNLELGVEQQREDEGGGQLGELRWERRQARRAEQALQQTRVSRPRERPLAPRGIAARVDLLTNGNGGLIRGGGGGGGGLPRVVVVVVRRSAARPRLDHQPPSPKLGSNGVRRRRRADRPVQTPEAADVPRVGAPAVIPCGFHRDGDRRVTVVAVAAVPVRRADRTRSKVKIRGGSVPSPRHRRRARRAHRAAVRDAQQPPQELLGHLTLRLAPRAGGGWEVRPPGSRRRFEREQKSLEHHAEHRLRDVGRDSFRKRLRVSRISVVRGAAVDGPVRVAASPRAPRLQVATVAHAAGFAAVHDVIVALVIRRAEASDAHGGLFARLARPATVRDGARHPNRGARRASRDPGSLLLVQETSPPFVVRSLAVPRG